MGHKGKLNERKDFCEKSLSFLGSAVHLADEPLFGAATKILSSLTAETEYLTYLQMFAFCFVLFCFL